MDQPQTITRDVLCVRCGYNLRGLDLAGRCPECNNPIAQSVEGDLLPRADPVWLERLQLGMTVKLWNLVVGFLVGVVAGILVGAAGLPGVFVTLVALAGAALGLWAAFLITSQEPRVSMTEDPVSLRRVVRGCAVAVVFAQVMQQAGEYAPNGAALLVIGLALGVGASVVSYFGEFVYLRRFARRIPDARLVRSTTTVMWGMATMVALAGAGGLITAATAPPAAGPSVFGTAGLAVGGAIACAAGIGLIICVLWYIRLLLQYRAAFRAASMESRLDAIGQDAGGAAPEWPIRPQ